MLWHLLRNPFLIQRQAFSHQLLSALFGVTKITEAETFPKKFLPSVAAVVRQCDKSFLNIKIVFLISRISMTKRFLFPALLIRKCEKRNGKMFHLPHFSIVLKVYFPSFVQISLSFSHDRATFERKGSHRKFEREELHFSMSGKTIFKGSKDKQWHRDALATNCHQILI